MKQRLWVSWDEMERVKRAIHENLGSAESCLIPFDSILPLVSKPVSTRLTWCRQFRRCFCDAGLRVGIRTAKSSYIVRVVDRYRWHSALSGIAPEEGVEDQTQQDLMQVPDMPDLRHLIPSLDPTYVTPEFIPHLKMSLNDGPVLLIGPTGSGKSLAVQQLAALHHRPFLRVNLSGETSVTDLLGSWRIQGREMNYMDGPVTLAVKAGAWLCLDELDAAQPSVLFALQSLLEGSGTLFNPDLARWIVPHPDFRLAATANTTGRGDDSGLYSGTNVLNEAFLDRFGSVFLVGYLETSSELEVVRKKVKGIDRALLERMGKVAADLRSALVDGVIYSSFSTRKLIAWAGKTVQIGDVHQAAQYTILNKLSDDDRRVVNEVLQRHLGGSI